jgi:hypothetical protein
MNAQTTIRRSLWLATLIGTTVTNLAFAGNEEASASTACLRRTDIRSTKVLDGRNILFTTRDRTTYNNQLARQCPGMHRGSAISLTYADNGKLCVGGSFTVLMNTGASTNTISYFDPVTQQQRTMQGPSFVPGATCSLGVFGAISKAEIDALVAATDTERRARRRSDRDAVKAEAVQPAPAAGTPASEEPAAR